MKTPRTILLTYLALLFSTAGFSQVYVSTAGDDLTGTGTFELPFKTINKAVIVAAIGDTVFVAPGTYPATEPIYINKALTIENIGSDAVLIDAAAWADTLNDYVIGIVNTSDVRIDGLTIANKIGHGSKGIWVLANAGAIAPLNNITIENCIIQNVGWTSDNLSEAPETVLVANAITVQGGNGTYPITNILLSSNEVSNCATGWGEAVTLTGNIDGFAITNNEVFEIANIGIVVAGNYISTGAEANNQARNGTISLNKVYNCMSAIANSAGIYLDGALNCIIERNELYQCGVGVSVGAEENPLTGFGGLASGHVIRNNSIYDNVITGAIFGGVISGDYESDISDTKIYNNTFYKNRTGAIINGVTTIGGLSVESQADNFGGEVHFQNSSGITFKNNIMYASDEKKAILFSFGYTVSNFESDYNLYYRDLNTDFIIDLTGAGFNDFGMTKNGSYNLTLYADSTGQDLNSVEGLPGFTNELIFDFGLVDTAFAADKGDPVYDVSCSDSLDYQGEERYVNGRIDIGHSEVQNDSLSSGLKPNEFGQPLGSIPTVNIYPNPASDIINFDFGHYTVKGSITAIDLNGRILFNKVFDASNSESIQIADLDLSPQMLLIKIQVDEHSSYHKVFIK